MKRFIYILTTVAASVLLACCSKVGESAAPAGNQGAVTFDIGVSGGVRAAGYPWNECDIRLYKYNDRGLRELVRHYFDFNDMPREMWLTEGRYHIDILMGDDDAAVTKTRPHYRGNADFEIEKGRTTAVEIVCNIQNTIVKVLFDEQTVGKTFDIDYRAAVMVGSRYDASLEDDDTACLTFTEDGECGYFIIPEGQHDISFCFLGHSSDNNVFDGSNAEGESPAGEIHEHYDGYALDPERLLGYCYTIKFKYSPSAQGFISWNIEIELEEPATDVDHNVGINPAPKPSVEGEGFDFGLTRNFDEPLGYRLKASDKDIISVEITVDEEEPFTVDCSEEGDKENGISIAYGNNGSRRDITLTLGKEFAETLPAGEHTINIKAYTSSTIFGEASSIVRVAGICDIESDEWAGRATLQLYAFGEDVKLLHREAETEQWNEAETVKDAETDYIYTAVLPISAARSYEYRLSCDGEEEGLARRLDTNSEQQIYNAGFEIWTGSAPLLPYTNDSDQWWDTGNHGSATLNKNVTTNSTDAHGGSYSAYLKSQYVSVVGFGKFAAGNIFIGKYIDTKGTDGVIGFGKRFAYTFRPAKLRFWAKAKAGTVDRTGSNSPIKSGETDVNEVYICLTNMGGPHIVNTKEPETFLTLDGIKTISYCSSDKLTVDSVNDQTDGHVIAYGFWRNSETVDSWTCIEIELIYNDEYEGEVPNYLMLTASSSKYGDYFSGSTSSELYIDDVEFVY